MNERKDFPTWKVEQVYLAQDGACLKCGNSLEDGFHRHHKDGNPANNEISNLELLCVECQRATLGDAITEHGKQEEKVLSTLNKLLDDCFAGKNIAGATIEKIIEALGLSLSVSRSLNKFDQGIESPPVSLALLKRMQETRMLQETYLERARTIKGSNYERDSDRILCCHDCHRCCYSTIFRSKPRCSQSIQSLGRRISNSYKGNVCVCCLYIYWRRHLRRIDEQIENLGRRFAPT